MNDWHSPLLPESGERAYNERGVMIARNPATAIGADGEPNF